MLDLINTGVDLRLPFSIEIVMQYVDIISIITISASTTTNGHMSSANGNWHTSIGLVSGKVGPFQTLACTRTIGISTAVIRWCRYGYGFNSSGWKWNTLFQHTLSGIRNTSTDFKGRMTNNDNGYSFIWFVGGSGSSIMSLIASACFYKELARQHWRHYMINDYCLI